MPAFRNIPVDVVIDVRTKVEFWLGHLEGAINIPVDQLPEAMASHPEITPESRILVYCAAGARSAAAAQRLAAAGFANVTDGGGIGDARSGFTP